MVILSHLVVQVHIWVIGRSENNNNSPMYLLFLSLDRSAENKRVGDITVAAWQMEEKADQRMSVGHLPDSINGRVRGWEGLAGFFSVCTVAGFNVTLGVS